MYDRGLFPLLKNSPFHHIWNMAWSRKHQFFLTAVCVVTFFVANFENVYVVQACAGVLELALMAVCVVTFL